VRRLLDRVIFLGDAEAILAGGEDSTPGTIIGLAISGIAAIIISVIILRGYFGSL
jgi:hypothetical protein